MKRCKEKEKGKEEEESIERYKERNPFGIVYVCVMYVSYGKFIDSCSTINGVCTQITSHYTI